MAVFDGGRYSERLKEYLPSRIIQPRNSNERVTISNFVPKKLQAKPEKEIRLPMQKNILDEVFDYYGRYVAYPSVHAQVVNTLWAAHCHFAPAFYTTPRLWVTSATRGCGKTRLKEITKLLVPNPVALIHPSFPSLFRLAAKKKFSILIDQTNTMLDAKDVSDIVGVISAGFQRGETVPRVNMNLNGETEFFEVFGPMMLVGIDNNKMPDEIEDRSIPIRLEKRLSTEYVEAYRPQDNDKEGLALRELLDVFSKENLEMAKSMRPSMPKEIRDRDADKWEPLFIVADVADVACSRGVGAKPWGVMVREAALYYYNSSRDIQSSSTGELLLKDVESLIIDGIFLDRISLNDLCLQLHNIEGSPWSCYSFGRPLSSKQLTDLLKPFGIQSTKIRFEIGTRLGYYEASFTNARSRHLTPSILPEITGTTATEATMEKITPEILQSLITPGMTYEEYQAKREPIINRVS